MRVISAAGRTVRRAAARAPRALRAQASRRTTTCRLHSFTPDTEVVLADGNSVPIKDLHVGDFVTATDPRTGVTTAQPVLDVIVGFGDKHLIRIHIDGSATAITATAHHPFSVDGQWKAAADLRAGDRLLLPQGRIATVGEVKDLGYNADTLVYNLTVSDIHTFSIRSGVHDVVVHNCRHDRRFIAGRNFSKKSKEKISQASRDRNGGVERCAYCGVAVAPAKRLQRGKAQPRNERQYDHKRARSRGGNNCPTCNGAVACRVCNRAKSNHRGWRARY